MSFYTSIAPYYDLIFPFDQNQIRFLEAVLDPQIKRIPGIRDGLQSVARRSFLDVGCGSGTVLSEFTDRFNKLSGIDLNTELLKLAAKKMFPGEEEKVELFDEDIMEMDAILRNDSFSFITCLGNTIPHLIGPDQIPRFFKSVFDRLESEGVFVFQTINYDRILDGDLRGLPTIQTGEVTFERYYSSPKKNGLIEFDTILCDAETELELTNSVDLYPVRKAQMEKYLNAVNFTHCSFYGSYSGEVYEHDSMLLIGVCAK
jgi:glycine/sarcosine N-methyltransferase